MLERTLMRRFMSGMDGRDRTSFRSSLFSASALSSMFQVMTQKYS
jgi:hypothetical protein